MISTLLAVSFTFTACATGIGKDAPLEFAFIGPKSDRAYEAMFTLDESVSSLCQKLEAAGFPRGEPVDVRSHRLWPIGAAIRFEPALTNFISGLASNGFPLRQIVYTGGSRDTQGICVADAEMPSALLALYSLDQAPFVCNQPIEQGDAYGTYHAAVNLTKGKRIRFSVAIESPMPQKIVRQVKSGDGARLLNELREMAKSAELEVLVTFDDSLTIKEATAIANALSAIDSPRIRINGSDGLFYRAFIPDEQWKVRSDRLQQPFEVYLSESAPDILYHIEEDWSGEGQDPVLTPQVIAFDKAKFFPITDTCFFYAPQSVKVSRLKSVMTVLSDTAISKWYVFMQAENSLHNTP